MQNRSGTTSASITTMSSAPRAKVHAAGRNDDQLAGSRSGMVMVRVRSGGRELPVLAVRPRRCAGDRRARGRNGFPRERRARIGDGRRNGREVRRARPPWSESARPQVPSGLFIRIQIAAGYEAVFHHRGDRRSAARGEVRTKPEAARLEPRAAASQPAAFACAYNMVRPSPARCLPLAGTWAA